MHLTSEATEEMRSIFEVLPVCEPPQRKTKRHLKERNNTRKKYRIFLEEISYLYGAMTYMATRQTVDVQLCNTFMDTLMNRGEEISKNYTKMIHPLTGKNNGADDLLKRVRELFCCNYILNNYQYTGIMEEFLHYLMGENVESICFYPEEGEKSGYLFLLAQLTTTAEKR